MMNKLLGISAEGAYIMDKWDILLAVWILVKIIADSISLVYLGWRLSHG